MSRLFGNSAKPGVNGFTSDGGWRRGNRLPLKETMDKALESSPAVTRMLVVNRTDDASQVSMREGRDTWYVPGKTCGPRGGRGVSSPSPSSLVGDG